MHYHPILGMVVFLTALVRGVTAVTSCGITPSYAHHKPEDFNSQAPDQFIVDMTVILGRGYGARTIQIQGNNALLVFY